MDPFAPRHQEIIISDIDLLDIVISIVVCGTPGEGIVHIVVADNMNALSGVHRRNAKRVIALELLQTFIAWTIQLRLEIVIDYSRTYRNVAADALTRQSVAKIEEWAAGKEFAWIAFPGVLGDFCASVMPGNLTNDLSPI